MMQIMFIVIEACGLAYFLFANRTYDFFSTAYIGSCVYFLPGLFGIVSDGADLFGVTNLNDSAYLAMMLVLLVILCRAVLFDRRACSPMRVYTIRGANRITEFCVAIAVVGFLMSIVT